MVEYASFDDALELAVHVRAECGRLNAAVLLEKKLNAAHAAGIAYGMAVQEQSEPAAPQSPTVGEVVADAVDWLIECWVEERSKMERDEVRQRLIDAVNSLREND